MSLHVFSSAKGAKVDSEAHVSVCCCLHVQETTARLNEKLYHRLPDWANTESIWEPGHGYAQQ